MAVVKKTKASDLQSLCKKLVTLLKKHYKPASHHKHRPVLETMLHAVCLENSTPELADASFERLTKTFQDYNEVRVSTFAELTPLFEGQTDPDTRAARIRSILQFVFEINFDFDFEPLRRKTLDLAEKQMQKIRFISSFIQLQMLQASMDAHVVPIDDRMRDAAVWLGLAIPSASVQDAADGLKSAVSKSDTVTFCDYFRCFALDPRFAAAFGKHKASDEGHDLDEMLDRATELIANAGKELKAKPKAESKPAAKASKPAPKASMPASKKPAAKVPAKATAVKKKPR